MKTCPICKAAAFDDAPTCYGCMYSFLHGASQEPPTPPLDDTTLEWLAPENLGPAWPAFDDVEEPPDRGMPDAPGQATESARQRTSTRTAGRPAEPSGRAQAYPREPAHEHGRSQSRGCVLPFGPAANVSQSFRRSEEGNDRAEAQREVGAPPLSPAASLMGASRWEETRLEPDTYGELPLEPYETYECTPLQEEGWSSFDSSKEEPPFEVCVPELLDAVPLTASDAPFEVLEWAPAERPKEVVVRLELAWAPPASSAPTAAGDVGDAAALCVASCDPGIPVARREIYL